MASMVKTYPYYKGDKKYYGYRFEIAPKIKEVEIDGKIEIKKIRQWKDKRAGCTKEVDAQRMGTEAQLQYEKHGNIKDANIALDTFFADWLKTINYDLQEATINSYAKKIRLYISPALGQYRLKSITEKDIQSLMNALYDSGLSVTTLVSIKGILTKSFTYAKTEGYFMQSPASDVKIPTRPRKESKTKKTNSSHKRGNKTRDVIPDEQIESIFKRFKEGDSTFIPLQLAYKCGLRLGEAYALTWDDVDFKNRTIRINKQVQYSDGAGYWFLTLPKYRSIRTIAIDIELCELLKREKERQRQAKLFNLKIKKGFKTLINEDFDTTKINDNFKNKSIPNFQYRIYENGIIEESEGNTKSINFVCTRPDGSYITPRTMQHASRIIHYDLGFEDFDFHSLRHTHTSKLVEMGANLKYIQARLGHKNLKVTLQIYTHLTEQMKKDGDKLIDDMFS